MATLTTKYDIGQRVWFASTAIEKRRHDCPDCLGSREWECKSPAGGVFTVACPRCAATYQSNDALRLDYSAYTGTSRPLTVGQITANSAPGSDWGEGNKYMCNETGIGGGLVYSEDDLFPTEEEALVAANIKAALANENPEGWVAIQFNKTAQFSDYELKEASMAAAESLRRNALYGIGYLLSDLEGAADMEDVRTQIAEWREKPENA